MKEQYIYIILYFVVNILALHHENLQKSWNVSEVGSLFTVNVHDSRFNNEQGALLI